MKLKKFLYLLLLYTAYAFAVDLNSRAEEPGAQPAPPGAIEISTTTDKTGTQSAAPNAPPAVKPAVKKPSTGSKIKSNVKTTIKHPVQQMKKIEAHVEKAVAKTAQTAVKETKEAVIGAHSLGGKLLQGLINVMIAASPGKTRVYLPAPSSDPNSGLTVGLLPVFLFVDDKEVVRQIFAPSITYNKIFKMTTTLRYYWYPRAGAQLFALGSYALASNHRGAIRYEDPRFFSDWFYFKFDFNHQYEGSNRFYGVGRNTQEDDQATYVLRENHLQVHTGVNFLGVMRATISHRYRQANIVDGPLDSLRKISSLSPKVIGADDAKTILAQRFTLSFDSRDLPMAPVSGHYFSVFSEIAGRYMGGDAKYHRAGADLRGFYPMMNNRLVTGWRLLGEGEDGSGVPFYEQSLLGGKDSLRGFGDARFVERKKATISIEERVRFYTLKAFNVNVDFEVTPFYEAGDVFNETDQFMLSELHHVAGVGFRTVVRPNVVGVIDLGFSDEGTALFVGIDYPF